jgi:hypothetical protein
MSPGLTEYHRVTRSATMVVDMWGHNGCEMRGDDVGQQRMLVREASEVLGISTDGVRMRVSRGSMESEKDESGRVWVWLDPAHADTRDRNRGGGQHSGTIEEVESLRDQVGYLRGVIEVRDAELQRAHQLLGESLSQLRALSPPAEADAVMPSEPYETSEVSPPGAEMPGPGPSPRRTLAGRLRGLWRG